MTEFKYNVRLGTVNFEVFIDTESKYGYFEHNDKGDNCGGGLWFDQDMCLMDYDGVFSLPTEVKDVLVMFHMIPKEEAYLF